MAGVKGRSGGRRPNTGGARPGAGRPRKLPLEIGVIPHYEDPKEFLMAIMNDSSIDGRARIDAAKALMPYVHKRLGEGGKKEARKAEAKKVASGKYAPAEPPKLVVNNS